MSAITTTVLNSLFSLIATFMKIILAPLDTLIMNGLPDVSIMINKISDFLSLCMQYVGFIIDALGIPPFAISLIVSYFVLKYSIHLLVYSFKIIISWVRALK